MNSESTSLTIIIPIYRLVGLRLRNFKFVLKNITAIGCDVVVCEQDSETNVSKYTTKCGAKYINTHVSEAEIIHKSTLINYAAGCTTSDYIWILDADFYTDFTTIVSYMDYTKHELVRPFESVVFLDTEESEMLVTSGSLTIQGDYKANNQTGKFSFLVDRELFLSVGGMDERFVGWGFQDLDFVENKLPKGVSVGVVKQPGYHLYHERAPQTHADDNYKLYSNTRNSHRSLATKPTPTEYLGRNFA